MTLHKAAVSQRPEQMAWITTWVLSLHPRLLHQGTDMAFNRINTDEEFAYDLWVALTKCSKETPSSLLINDLIGCFVKCSHRLLQIETHGFNEITRSAVD